MILTTSFELYVPIFECLCKPHALTEVALILFNFVNCGTRVFQYAIRLLLKIICTNLKFGLVLFLDDLQWSDIATLDLLKSICLDGDIPRLLLVGAYRSDEVPE